MCGSAKRQRTSPEFQVWGPSRQQADDLHTLSGRKPRKYKPGTTQYHPASVCANPFVRRQHARYTRMDRVTRPLGAASWLPLGRVRLDGPGASESPKCAPAPDALALPDAKPLPASAPDKHLSGPGTAFSGKFPPLKIGSLPLLRKVQAHILG